MMDDNARCKKIRWIDRRMRDLLLPQPSPGTYKEPRKALDYKEAQKMTPYPPMPAYRRSDYNVFYFAYIGSGEIIEFVQKNISDVDLLGYYIIEAFSARRKVVEEEESLSNWWNRYKKYFDEAKQLIRTCSAVLYLADSLEHMCSEVEHLIDMMNSWNKLIVAFVRHCTTESKSELDCVIEVYEILEGVSPPLLSQANFEWRIWCLDFDGKKFVNLEEIFQWTRKY